MSATFLPAPRGGGAATPLLLGALAVLLGLFGGFPFPLGGVVGGAGVGLAVAWRAARPQGSPLTALPALLAISAESVVAPPGTATELLAGLCGLALLLWLADGPARPADGPARSLPAFAQVALAVGLGWAIALVGPHGPSNVGIAAGLLVVAIVLLAILLHRLRLRAAVASFDG